MALLNVSELRMLMESHGPPAGAGRSVAALCDGLRELDAHLREHIRIDEVELFRQVIGPNRPNKTR